MILVGGLFVAGVKFFFPTSSVSSANSESVSAAMMSLTNTVQASEPEPQPVKPEDDPRFHAFRDTVMPLFATYCSDCHVGETAQAGFEIGAAVTIPELLKQHRKWEKVLTMIEAGAMPPADADAPLTDEDRAMITAWLRDALYNFDCDEYRDPGRVTIRRLNRNEYNNTIRDLLGVDFKPAADFPRDDVGYGFDNIGDVLSLPPLLMEKYLAAAEQITLRAIVNPDVQVAVGRKFAANELKVEGGGKAGDSSVSMYSNGTAFASIPIVVGGDYIVKIQAWGDQAGPDAAKMALHVGDDSVETFDVAATSNAPELYEKQVTFKAGDVRVAASFINDYYQPKSDDPKLRGDRNLYIGTVEIVGPLAFDPATLPQSHREILFVTPDENKSADDCTREILRRFGRRAFRRPVTDDDVAGYVDLARLAREQNETFEGSIQIAIQGMLVSPNFLFRVENDRDPHDPADQHKLADYELASRLSYFLWASMPDEELFALAEEGKLRDAEILKQQARRMLADPKSQALMENFAGQWLNLRNLAEVTPDTKTFPDFSEELRADMRRETELFFDSVVRNDKSILTLLDADYTFVNERLAAHYGMPNVKGAEFREVSLQGTNRAGVLTQASILTLTSNSTRTSPVKRGKWILENILGEEPPPPPPNVPALDKAQADLPDATLRQQLEQHRADPACAVCHHTMDALGFGFENFDAIGRWRDKDGDQAIDSSGTLPGEQKFQGPVELVQLIKQRRHDFGRLFTEKLLTYALGRGLEFYDRCTVDKIMRGLEEHDYRFSALLDEIVTSDPFIMRRGEREQP
ncbi:MAG: DUF1592 domain-containing protein [Planctomycetaceae bacterium]